MWRARGEAIQRRCCDQLGLDVVTVAHGIVEIANAAMVNALRLVIDSARLRPARVRVRRVRRRRPGACQSPGGRDRDPAMLIPLSPGITSALGCWSPISSTTTRSTLIQRLDRLDPTEVQASYQRMAAEGRATLTREGVPADADELRAPGRHALRRAKPRADDRAAGRRRSRSTPRWSRLARFHREHDRVYGNSAPSEPAELVNLRLTAIGRIARPRLREMRPAAEVAAASRRNRPVYFAERGGYVDWPIYDRNALGRRARIEAGDRRGAQLDDRDPPRLRRTVDRYGNLLLRPAATLEARS